MSLYYVEGGAALCGGGTRHKLRDATDRPRIVVRDVPGEAVALALYPPGASAPVVAELTPGRALDLAADLIAAARRRIPS